MDDDNYPSRCIDNSNIFSKKQNKTFIEAEQKENYFRSRNSLSPVREPANPQRKYQDTNSVEDEAPKRNDILLQMYIQIPGQSEDAILELRKYQSIEETAQNFAKKYSLLPDAQNQIYEALIAAIQETNISDYETGQRDGGFSSEDKQSAKEFIQEEEEEEIYETFVEKQDVNRNQDGKQYLMKTPVKEGQNPGERLYLRSEKQRKKREQEKIRMQLKEEERISLNFKKVPQINPKSKAIVEKKKALSQNGSNQEQATMKIVKTSLLKQHKAEKELAECTFHPQINNISSSLGTFLKQNRQHKDVYENLYANHQSKTQIVSSIQNSSIDINCTFQPNTEKSEKRKSNIQGSFLERNHLYQEKMKQKNQNRLYISQNFDFSTGKKLFEPNTHKSIEDDNDGDKEKRQGQQVFNELYSLSEKKRQSLIEEGEQQKREKQERQVKAIEQSSNLVEKARKRRIQEIFIQLDDDGDGLISGNAIGIDKVDKDVVLQLLPILQEIDQHNLELDFSQFYDGLQAFFNQMTLVDRQKFLRPQSSKSSNSTLENYSFKPQLNKRSLEIVKKHDYLEARNDQIASINTQWS